MEFAGIGLFQINSFIKMKLKNRSASKLLELFLIYDSHESKSASETTNLLVIFLYGLEFEASFPFFFLDFHWKQQKNYLIFIEKGGLSRECSSI